MEIIIGYKFEIVSDNGDYCEWHREHHTESPIYTTKEAAVAAIGLVKRARLANAKDRIKKYRDGQYGCEVSQGRSINKFLCECQKSLMSDYREILNEMARAKVIPIVAHDTPTNTYTQWSMA